MDKDKAVSLDAFIFRKLQPLRILAGFLNGELEMNEGDEITVHRDDLDNIVSTLEIFIEEYDRVSQYGSTGNIKKKEAFSDGKASIKAIA